MSALTVMQPRRRLHRSTDSCSTCMFYRTREGQTTGECRIDPPEIIQLKESAATMWPSPDPTDWCGEYRKPSRR